MINGSRFGSSFVLHHFCAFSPWCLGRLTELSMLVGRFAVTMMAASTVFVPAQWGRPSGDVGKGVGNSRGCRRRKGVFFQGEWLASTERARWEISGCRSWRKSCQSCSRRSDPAGVQQPVEHAPVPQFTEETVEMVTLVHDACSGSMSPPTSAWQLRHGGTAQLW